MGRNGIFVAVGDNGSVLTSENGVKWIERFIPARQAGTYAGFTIFLHDVSYDKGVFVAVGGFGTILTSLDGITWPSRPSGRKENFYDVTYGNGTFVVGGGEYSILLQSDPLY